MTGERDWASILTRELWAKPGTHLLINGNTGSGKTWGLYYAAENILSSSPNETILVNDRAKSSEILTYALLRPLRLIIPEGCDVHLDLYEPEKAGLYDIEKVYIKRFADVWTSLDPGRINVLVIRPFLRTKKQYATVIAGIFEELLDLAAAYRLRVPLCIIWDEFHEVAPASGDKYGVSETLIAQLEDLRSKRIRFIATSHGWTKMVRGARMSFPIICAKGGTILEKESLRLRRFNATMEGLRPDQAIFVFRDKTFTDKLTLPPYRDGGELGRVTYSCPYMRPSSCRDTTIASIYADGGK